MGGAAPCASACAAADKGDAATSASTTSTSSPASSQHHRQEQGGNGWEGAAGQTLHWRSSRWAVAVRKIGTGGIVGELRADA
ncbi:hypothetical protein VHAB30_40700 [Variovorax boronicumulans]|nr:hypothetical protein VHAB30_40700 [Variovorax boronicumulans]